MDIDGDGITDNLLVAAPMFFSAGLEKGKVYIYKLTELVGKNLFVYRHGTHTNHLTHNGSTSVVPSLILDPPHHRCLVTAERLTFSRINVQMKWKSCSMPVCRLY